jgi:glutamate 5-kinase
MTKIQIELPDATAKAAREAGVLEPKTLARLVSDEIRRRAAGTRVLAIAGGVAAAGIEPMSMDEIDAEVKAVRAERRRRASRH